MRFPPTAQAMPRTAAQLDEKLLELIAHERIADQFELQAALARHGIKVSQPTLSRHLTRLGISKRAGRYASPGDGSPSALAVIPAPPNLVVLRTRPGFANAVAAVLDHQPLPGQAGTIAGDDTVFVAVAEGHTLAEMLDSARYRFLPED
jgi:transcriptional regulator of arginine metabolism